MDAKGMKAVNKHEASPIAGERGMGRRTGINTKTPKPTKNTKQKEIYIRLAPSCSLCGSTELAEVLCGYFQNAILDFSRGGGKWTIWTEWTK